MKIYKITRRGLIHQTQKLNCLLVGLIRRTRGKNRQWLILMLLMMVVFVFGGCAGVKTIPEISPYLSDQQLMDLSDKNLTGTIMAYDSKLIFTTLEGEIFRWDSEKQMKEFLVNLNSNIAPDIFYQDNYLALKRLKTGKYTIFDPGEMKEVIQLEDTTIKGIVGLNHEIVVYLTNANELVIFNYRSLKTLKNLKLKANQKVFNAEFRGDKLFILCGGDFYAYYKASDTVEKIPLPEVASSGFLMDGNIIYYGSGQRELVKFSLSSRRNLWSFKIGDLLTRKPQKIGEYIVIVPDDNNIYFYNTSGTLYWWEKLNSTCLLPPVLMKENVAVFLWNKDVKFFQYPKKQITTYPLDRKIKSNPVRIDDYIFVVSEDKLKLGEDEDTVTLAHRLSRIGNNYGIEILSNPQYIKPVGKSVRFDIRNFNLIEPNYKITIVKNQPGDQNLVFEKEISFKDKPSFLWIPKESVQYRLVIKIAAKNKSDITFEETFTAVEVDKLISNYYYQIQTQSDSNRF